MIILGPVVARPAAQILGAPVARFRGVTGRLARENAMRNPRRTAGTASALLFFITVVTLFTVFFASVKASIDASVDQSFGGDLVIGPESAFGGSGISPTAAEQTAALPQVQTAVGVGGGQVEIDGHGTFVTVADPGELGKIIDLDVQAGRLDRLGPDQMAVYAGHGGRQGLDRSAAVSRCASSTAPRGPCGSAPSTTPTTSPATTSCRGARWRRTPRSCATSWCSST